MQDYLQQESKPFMSHFDRMSDAVTFGDLNLTEAIVTGASR
jgi:hypothetical protein